MGSQTSWQRQRHWQLSGARGALIQWLRLLLLVLVPSRADAMPKPARKGTRDVATDLREVALVSRTTVGLQQQAVDDFAKWLSARGMEVGFRDLILAPQLLVLLFRAYGAWLFASSRPLYRYLMLLTYAQRVRPSLRQHLAGAWQIATAWRLLDPGQHRRPLPKALLQAMIALAVLNNWVRFAAVTLIAFLAPARIGEVLRASRRAVVTPMDACDPGSDRLYVQIDLPKTRTRGGAAVQHITVTDPLAVHWVQNVVQDLPRALPIYPFGASAYRRRFDAILQALGVTRAAGFTPGSLRGGGAVKAYADGCPISDLLWRMRIRNLETLSHYLQEVSAATSLADLPPTARESISTFSALYAVLIR